MCDIFNIFIENFQIICIVMARRVSVISQDVSANLAYQRSLIQDQYESQPQELQDEGNDIVSF